MYMEDLKGARSAVGRTDEMRPRGATTYGKPPETAPAPAPEPAEPPKPAVAEPDDVIDVEGEESDDATPKGIGPPTMIT
mgnify:CR=1 FL=1